jgi:hypothetical protein
MIKSILRRLAFFLKDKARALFFEKMKFDPDIESLVLRPKTRMEIAEEYGITVETLRCRLRGAKVKIPPGIIFPKHIKLIYYALGIPPNLKTP